MDTLVLNNLSAEEQERLQQLEQEVLGQDIIPLLQLLTARFKISYDTTAVYAGMDVAAFSKFMNGENREFKPDYVDNLLDDLVDSEGLLIAEKVIWHRALSVAAVWHYISYKVVDKCFETVEDLTERKNKVEALRRSTFEILTEQYHKSGNSLPLTIPLTSLLLNDLLSRSVRTDKLPKFTPPHVTIIPKISIIKDRILLNRTPRYIEPELIFIPASEFWMGSTDGDQEAAQNEKPQHKVHVPDFWIARYPVTNEDYNLFLRDNPAQVKPNEWESRKHKTDHPVRGVTWRDAIAYVQWLSNITGKLYTLPSEAQWEKAARGTGGRIYPWGNEWDATRCNTTDSKLGDATSVGQYSPSGDSPYGIADMSGNVWEWCLSKYKPYPYTNDDGRDVIDRSNDARVLRGGAFFLLSPFARCAYRLPDIPYSPYRYGGFRICAPAVS